MGKHKAMHVQIILHRGLQGIEGVQGGIAGGSQQFLAQVVVRLAASV